ncbi:non-ribosomal peptide synthetase [Nocardia terpenica]|uniref:non-ribosomal peptide synthetase n=1 Tax=Nocardia terpenica TaxID=455432 RepID=UPI0018954574|nr:non-ribosomal peptide synthetase [Nocardia terpenica]MBF6063711.1 non-ribosomal peptide synthetase [Nocardia terpenica]MBF6107087.1 non-ribosomal peptide synthetase [Nocardia terpenica]MBF6114260.1 non-ribosomal peptide synthetase [Nocardia terpenica]MBF6121653.1 non-ribosomal peptide synthetase [Nocardia terpenica]MBF6154068.1 non-ribosomal peptide synthetase [Nocardia terpenica]
MTSNLGGRADHDRAYRRPISPVEQQFIAAGPDAAVTLQLCVVGDGSLTAADLERAVAVAGDACPGSRCAAVDGYMVDTGVPPVVRDAGEITGDIGDLADLRRRPGGDGRPLCEVILARRPAGALSDETGSATVVFRADHALMDARGLVLWAAAVFAALREQTPTPATDTITDVELATRLLAELPDAGDRKPPMLPPEWALVLPRTSKDANGPLWRRRSIEGVHHGLVARLVAQLAARQGRVRCLIPVDLRRHDPSVSSTANLVLQVVIDASADDDWTDLHARLLSALADRRELDMCPPPDSDGGDPDTIRLIQRGLNRIALDQGVATATAIVSHWGRLRRADYSTAAFTARGLYTLPVIPPGAPVVIDAIEVEGRTDVSVGWYDDLGVGPAAEQLLAELSEAVWPAERSRWEGNDTARPLPETTVVEDLAATVAATPDAVAIAELDGTEIAYRELDAHADRIVGALARHGVRRGDVVGIVAGRSAATIAAIWGVLRAGAAYLPLDTAHPDARISDLLADAGAPLCLIEREQTGRALVPAGVAAIVLEDALADDANSERPEPIRLGPDDLAYVIYTSGSTGKPKGVQIEHGALANYVRWATREFGVRADSRMPWLTSPSFDVSATTLYAAIAAGGAIVPVTAEPAPDVLREVLRESRATEITLTPSHLELIGRLGITVAGVRALIVIGEQLRTAVARRAREVFGPDCRILNEYGPTEATVGVSVHEYDDAIDGGPDAAAVVPIGRPLDNCTMHVLDDDGRHAEIGEVGRLFLGGVQLARGYRGRPDLDQQRFVRLADGERVYDTGDLAQVRPSGAMEFHGRTDDQIKILGHRIEPAEIVQEAEAHPDVTQAVVRARAPRPGAAQVLCMWACLRPGAPPGAAEDLERHLRNRLPHYMIPAATVYMEVLPQTVNGKVDALSLPNPFERDAEAWADAQDAPGATDGDEVTAAVAAIWSEVLHLPEGQLPVSTMDFHRFGGDSLSLLLMIDRVANEVVGPPGNARLFGRLGDLIRKPTIEHVAALARAARSRALDRTGSGA